MNLNFYMITKNDAADIEHILTLFRIKGIQSGITGRIANLKPQQDNNFFGTEEDRNLKLLAW